MKFRNKTDGLRMLPALGRAVDAGAELEVTPEQAQGFVLQCGDEGAWEPADDEATAAVAAALAPPVPADEPADEDMTVDQIKAALAALDQPVGGNKTEPRERLAQAKGSI